MFTITVHNYIILFQDKSGWVPINILFEVCESKRLHFNHEGVSALASLVGLIKDGYVNYGSFVELIDVDKPLPCFAKIDGKESRDNIFFFAKCM